ncbi:hypothetical protein K466DRAFT_525109 [Polyporus arcularius HHB13444]|uniref:NACHT domain-containing protein n=1 Tax=Polyporus arcularius HHB13444 TaxID=1314778 RepID=A0A5C3PBA6_9APHY|nr:hypothetical protein K466DRAFT_525109 [Polyporus arcularius HHB13444]
MTCFKVPKISLAAIAVLDGTVISLEATKDTITAAAPIPGLSIALEALITLLKKIQGARSNCDALVTLCGQATSLANMLEGLANTITTKLTEYPKGSLERRQADERAFGTGSRFHRRVEKLQIDLRTICAEANELSQRSYFAKFVHSTGDAEVITGLKDRMGAACQRFQIEGNITIEALADEILNFAKIAEEERVLDKIPRADEAHYLSAANAMKARLQVGTRDQILKRLERWESEEFAVRGVDCAHLPVYVLVGEAGTGKSTIASEFAKRLQGRHHLGASFFFTRGVHELNSPRKFFSTVASQLAQSQTALRGHIVDAAREHLRTGALQQLEREFEDLIHRPLSALSSEDPTHPPIFVIVDALDECTEEGQELVPVLLRLLLLTAAKPGSPLRVFLTSRPEPHYIHRVFTTPDLNPYISVISIQEYRSSVTDDIERLVRARLAEHETSKRWSEEDPSRVTSIVEKSEALFIYARTAIDFLLADVDDLRFIQERYENLMGVEEVFGLDPLDTLYRTVLENVFPPKDRFPQMQDRLKRVLGYLVGVLNPDGISPATLEKLTNMPAVDSVLVLNKLRSVVLFERDNVNSRFRIIHATFREFLVNHRTSGDVFHVRAGQVHGQLADDCMAVIRYFRDRAVALVLQLLTGNVRDFDYVSYAYKYRNHHFRSRKDPLCEDGDNCQPTDEDDVSLLAPIVSYIDAPDPSSMRGLIRNIVRHMRESQRVGGRFGEVLFSLEQWVSGWGNSVEELTTGSGQARMRRIQIALLPILLDIQALEKFGAVCQEAPSSEATSTLDDQHVRDLETAVKTLNESCLTDHLMDDQYVILQEGHNQFHKAIITAGLAPGHQREDEYEAYQEQKRLRALGRVLQQT